MGSKSRLETSDGTGVRSERSARISASDISVCAVSKKAVRLESGSMA